MAQTWVVGSAVSRAWPAGALVERIPDDAEATYGIFNITWALGSVVERVPDKNEVDGSIPSVPTESAHS